MSPPCRRHRDDGTAAFVVTCAGLCAGRACPFPLHSLSYESGGSHTWMPCVGMALAQPRRGLPSLPNACQAVSPLGRVPYRAKSRTSEIQECVMVSSITCPACGKKLGYHEEKGGRAGFCPRCGERVMTPRLTQPPPGDEPESSETESGETAGPLTRMSFRVRCVVWGLAVAAGLGILVAVSSALLPWDVGPDHSPAYWALLFSACSLLLLGLVFHGQLTGCPSCGWWWTRERAEQKFLDREIFEKEGVSYCRS